MQLCKDVPVAVAGLFGIPPVLVSGSASETQTREAFRRFVAATLAPLSTLIADALAPKLETDLSINLHALRAFDVQGQARALAALVKSGVSVDDALRTVGLDE